jgi:hypothetical protein
MLQSNDLSRSFTTLNQDNTLIVVIEMSLSSWLVAGIVPGVERQPLKKLEPDEDQLLKLKNRWRRLFRPGMRLNAWWSPMKRGVTDFGWRAGFESGALRPMSCTRRASPCRVNIGAPKPTGSIRNC